MTFSIDNPEGGCNHPIRKICLGKTLRITRVNAFHNLKPQYVTIDNALSYLEWTYCISSPVMLNMSFYLNLTLLNNKRTFFPDTSCFPFNLLVWFRKLSDCIFSLYWRGKYFEYLFFSSNQLIKYFFAFVKTGSETGNKISQHGELVIVMADKLWKYRHGELWSWWCEFTQYNPSEFILFLRWILRGKNDIKMIDE